MKICVSELSLQLKFWGYFQSHDGSPIKRLGSGGWRCVGWRFPKMVIIGGSNFFSVNGGESHKGEGLT